VGFAPPPYDRVASTLVQKVASPDLEGAQVAVLRLHAAVSWPRNSCTILAEPGECLTQLQYLLQLRLYELRRTPLSRSSRRHRESPQSPAPMGPSLRVLIDSIL
jgi:hypothetical protein